MILAGWSGGMIPPGVTAAYGSMMMIVCWLTVLPLCSEPGYASFD